MRIHADFPGGNIIIEGQYDGGNTVTLERELRDTIDQNWFYWAFCVEGAAGRTVTFRFRENRIGYFGPAVSHDLETWNWLDELPEDKWRFEYKGPVDLKFTYTFGPDEDKVYFAHHMLYPMHRFTDLAHAHGIEVRELCRSRKGRSVPYIEFGEGDKAIVMTAGHHACESTGMYVLEGVLQALMEDPIPGYKYIAVPFVDFDGVLDGDQGKERYPYDHNRDYDPKTEAIYPETAAIRRFTSLYKCRYAFDFHSPWHIGDQNDWVFIPQKSVKKLPALTRFGRIFETTVTPDSMQYKQKNDYPPNTGWNREGTPCFGTYFVTEPDNDIAFSLETTYFGTDDNRISQARMLREGACFKDAVKQYIDTREYKLSFTGDLMCYPVMTENSRRHYDMHFSRVKGILNNCDYLVGNLETPIAGRELKYTYERYCFNTPDEYLDALKKSNFDMLSLATNHSYDRGEQGVLNTLKACRARGFDTVGEYASAEEREQIFVKEFGDLKVAFLNYTYGINALDDYSDRKLAAPYLVNMLQPEENSGVSVIPHWTDVMEETYHKIYDGPSEQFYTEVKPYLDRIKADIEKARKAADYVILLVHCGGQYSPEPDCYTEFVMKELKSYGPDIIIGNHPHIIQKCTVEDGFVTAYSLGNFMYVPSVVGPKEADHTYNALFNLYLKKDADGKVHERVNFRIMKVLEENGLPYAVDAYKYSTMLRDRKMESEIIQAANTFAGYEKFTELQPVYELK